MRVEQLDVHQRQPAGRQRPLGGQHRVVLEVLVVDRVELGALHQREQVLHLDRYPAVVRDERPQATGEPDDVRDVGVDVVQADQVGRPVLSADLLPGLRREERRERGHALRPRGLADVHRRLDPQAPDASLCDVLQQVAVVARHLDDERRRPELETLDGRIDEPPRVLHPRTGKRREVGVLGERLLRRDQRRELGEQAGLAHPDVQRVGQLRALQRAFGEEQLARRGRAEVHEAAQSGRPAQPTGDCRRGCGDVGGRRGLGQHPGPFSRRHQRSPMPSGRAVGRWGSLLGRPSLALHRGRPSPRCRSPHTASVPGCGVDPPWCKGSTSDFGSDGPGSNPGGGAVARRTVPRVDVVAAAARRWPAG